MSFCSIVSFCCRWGDPPHKRGAEILPGGCAAQNARYDDRKEAHFWRSPGWETERGGYTYTVETLEQLSRTPGEEYDDIIGADTLFELVKTGGGSGM